MPKNKETTCCNTVESESDLWEYTDTHALSVCLVLVGVDFSMQATCIACILSIAPMSYIVIIYKTKLF